MVESKGNIGWFKHQQRGMLALEPAILMLIFAFTLLIVNNGIVATTKAQWGNAARSAAYAGTKKLTSSLLITINGQAVTEARNYAIAHKWFGGQINSS